MPDTGTSLEIKVLLLIAAGLTGYAWWLSDRQSRRYGRFVRWVEDRYSERWQALPWTARKIHRVGAIEHLRRGGLGDDPQFMERYRQNRRAQWPQFWALFAGMAAIGLVALGVRYFGWMF